MHKTTLDFFFFRVFFFVGDISFDSCLYFFMRHRATLLRTVFREMMVDLWRQLSIIYIGVLF